MMLVSGWEIGIPTATSLLGMWAGVLVARYQFDLASQEKAKQAAATLRVDLQRIDRTLGDSANVFGATWGGMRFEVPAIHRWSEPLIIQLAIADHRIVAACMELDRELHNLESLVSTFFLLKETEEDAREHLRALMERPPADDASPSVLLEWAAQRVTAEDRLKDSRERVREGIQRMQGPHANAKRLIARLVSYTTYIADTRLKEFLQLPEESSPPPE